MADNYLITGYWGEPHITAENDRGINAATFGKGRFVLPVGREFHAEYIGNNTIRMYDGKLMDNGAAAGIPAGEYVDLLIANAGQGKKRNDLIVFQYSQDGSTFIESGKFVVVQGTETSGTASDPALTQQDLLSNEATFDQFALWRVPVSGTAISAPVKVFAVSANMKALTPTIFNISIASLEGGEAVFKDGQNASQLYNLLESNKPVEVRCQIPNPLATTYAVFSNTDFMKLSTGNGSTYQWEFQMISAGGIFFCTLSPNSLECGFVPLTDYVEEQGTKDGWTYRKWSSGVAECWKTHLERVPANTTDNDVFVSFPFTFASVPFVGCSLQAGGSTNYNAFVIQGGITVSDVRLHFRNNYNGEAVIGAALLVKGSLR